MLGFTHLLARHWLRQAGEQTLSNWQRDFLSNHLARCQRCRSYALALAEFLHESDPQPGLDSYASELLHQRVMAGVRQIEGKEHQRLWANRPLISKTFFPSLALALFLLTLIVFLSLPSKQPKVGILSSGQGNFHQSPLPVPTPVKDNPAKVSSNAQASSITFTASSQSNAFPVSPSSESLHSSSQPDQQSTSNK